MGTPKLLSCPFCGGKPRYGMQLDPNSGKFYKWVMCTCCKSCTGRSLIRTKVAEAWNNRVKIDSIGGDNDDQR